LVFSYQDEKVDMDMAKIKIKIFMITIVVVLVTLGFTALYNLSKFQNNLEESLLETYTIAGKQGVRYIEYAVGYGKDLNNFYGIEGVLNDIKGLSLNIRDVHLFDMNKTLLFSTEANVKRDFAFDEEYDKEYDKEPSGEKILKREDGYHINLPLRDAKGSIIGFMDIVIASQSITGRIHQFIFNMMIYLGIILIVVTGSLFIYLRIGNLFKDQYLDGKRLLNVLMMTLLTSQILFGLLTFMDFNEEYRSVARENVEIVSNAVKNDIESVVKKGVTYRRMKDMEGYFQQVVYSTKGIGGVYITQGETVTHSVLKEEKRVARDQVSSVLLKDTQDQQVTLHLNVSENNIRNKLFMVLLDALTVLIISIIFMIEMLGMIILSVNKFTRTQSEEDKRKYGIRALAFVVFLTTSFYVSFIPIISKQLYVPFLKIPKNFLIGMPFAMEMLFGVLATIFAGVFLDRHGWKKIFAVGGGFVVLGNILSGIANTIIPFTIFRGISGLGFGLLLMSIRSIVFMADTVESRNEGIAGINVSASAGVTCGVVTGAMIFDRTGFKSVFWISAALMFLAMIVLFALGKTVLEEGGKKSLRGREVLNTKGSSILKVILNPSILFFTFIIIIPARLSRTFLGYYFPLFASDQGVTQSTIGKVFMLSSLVSILFSSIVIKYSTRYLGVRNTIFSALLFMGLSVWLFAASGTMWMIVFTIMILSVCDDALLAASTNHYVGLEALKDIGEGKAVSLYSTSEKFGDAVSPLLYGAFIAGGLVAGMGYIGAFMAGGGVMFAFITSLVSKKRRAQNHG
jgi:predicted MFS family arabinose efflux permease